MTVLSSLIGQSASGNRGGEDEALAEELARRPAYASGSTSMGHDAKLPLTGDEDQMDEEEEAVIQTLLSPQAHSPTGGFTPRAGGAAVPKGLTSAESPGGLKPPTVDDKQGHLSHMAGLSQVADVAAMTASAEVAGGSIQPTSFLGSLSFVQASTFKLSTPSLRTVPDAAVQVQMLSFIVVFSASGLVSVDDMIFAIFASVYCFLLSVWAFPVPVTASDATHPLRGPPPPVFSNSRIFKIHVALGAVLGMFLPLSYVLGGFARGDHVSVQSATPHLFLLCCQVLTENILVTLPRCALPVRALLPIMYNTRRIFSLAAWTRSLYNPELGVAPSAAAPESIAAAAASAAAAAATSMSSPPVQGMPSMRFMPGQPHPYWCMFGQFLAVANLIYWSLNLFAFLIPVFLPLAFRRHMEAEMTAARKPGLTGSKKVD